MIRGVIWDVDGTLADTIPMIVRILQEVIVDSGGPSLSRPEVEALFGPTEEGLLANVLGDRAPAAFEKFLVEYEQRHDDEVTVFEGVGPVIRRLNDRGVRQAVVTGKGARSAAITLRHLGYEQVFDDVAAGSTKGQIKDVEIQRIVAGWSFDPRSVVYIGDHRRDVEDAHSAGVRAAVAAWSPDANPTWAPELQPEIVLRTTDDLKDWIDQIT